jgi:hypothetical protein
VDISEVRRRSSLRVADSVIVCGDCAAILATDLYCLRTNHCEKCRTSDTVPFIIKNYARTAALGAELHAHTIWPEWFAATRAYRCRAADSTAGYLTLDHRLECLET